MYHIEREISEQPEVIRRLLAEQQENITQIAAAIREYDPAYVVIAARGTSDNAGRYAQYLMGIEANLPVMLATPSVHTLYQSPPKLAGSLVIGISQSGRSEDIFRVIEDANAQGALTLTITNNPESRIAQAGKHHINLLAGEEISVAATKTYTAQLTALAMLVAAMVDKPTLTKALTSLPDIAIETLRTSEAIPGWVQRYRYAEQFAAIGRGYNYATAFEIGQKVKEMCAVTVEEYSEADFRHGPIAIIQRGFPVLLIAPDGKPLSVLRDLQERLCTLKAETLVISNNANMLESAQQRMPLPANMPEWLSPIAAVIPGQIFAFHLTLARGLPVDEPEGISKITDTI